MLERKKLPRICTEDRICSDVQSERIPEGLHRLQVDQHVVLGSFAGRLDRKVRVALWIEARVASHGLFELTALMWTHVRCEVHEVEPGVALSQMERLDKTVKVEARYVLLRSEEGAQPVKHARVELDPKVDQALGFRRLALEAKSRAVLDRLTDEQEQKN